MVKWDDIGRTGQWPIVRSLRRIDRSDGGKARGACVRIGDVPSKIRDKPRLNTPLEGCRSMAGRPMIV